MGTDTGISGMSIKLADVEIPNPTSETANPLKVYKSKFLFRFVVSRVQNKFNKNMQSIQRSYPYTSKSVLVHLVNVLAFFMSVCPNA